MVQIVFHHRER